MDQQEIIRTLSAPITINGLQLKNRYVMAPVSNHMSDENGFVSDREVQFYARRAAGGVGLIVVGTSWVNPTGRGKHKKGICDDKFIEGLSKMTAAVHENGGKMSIQLFDPGRYGNGTSSIPVAPSAEAWPAGNTMPHALTAEEVEGYINNFADAALRAKQAGFDMVELHSAHGYLIAEFLSQHANHRTDEWGGSFQKRFRFLQECLIRSRAKVGADFPISVRLSGTELVPTGLTIEDQVENAKLLEAQGVDLISVSCGLSPYAGIKRCIPNMNHPMGCNLEYAEKIKAAVSVPVMVSGRLNNAALAAQVLKDGKADLIGLARQLIADPDYVNKVFAGKEDTAVFCMACNNCHDAKSKDRSTRCVQNPEAGREYLYHLTPAAQPKKVFVIGGGPGGMEAAKVAAQRGHKVVLVEKSDHLGGRVNLACIPDLKKEYDLCRANLTRDILRAGVEVRLNSSMSAADIAAEKPDAVLLACGGDPLTPPIPGIDGKNVIHAEQALRHPETAGKTVAVIGGGDVGLETAYRLSQSGRKVIVIEALDKLAADMMDDARLQLMTAMENYDVTYRLNTKVKRLEGDTVFVAGPEGEAAIGPVDTVVNATGYRPSAVAAALSEELKVPCTVIGDAKAQGNVANAVFDGYRAAYDL